MPQRTLLSHACFGPVQYFVHLTRGPVIIEKYANYSRQTYRNRYIIAAANKPLSLSIPVEKGNATKIPDKDVRIAYHTPWQKNHLRSIISAYNASPFLEFYIDDLMPFFEKKYTFLMDFNLKATELICNLLELNTQISFSETYIQEPPKDEILDMRDRIHPKRPFKTEDPVFQPLSYNQVFDERHGFVANLSVLDLLFNKGPEARMILEKSLKD
jgi:hypothetical protein